MQTKICKGSHNAVSKNTPADKLLIQPTITPYLLPSLFFSLPLSSPLLISGEESNEDRSRCWDTKDINYLVTVECAQQQCWNTKSAQNCSFNTKRLGGHELKIHTIALNLYPSSFIVALNQRLVVLRIIPINTENRAVNWAKILDTIFLK